jgi:hypothetical protein
MKTELTIRTRNATNSEEKDGGKQIGNRIVFRERHGVKWSPSNRDLCLNEWQEEVFGKE